MKEHKVDVFMDHRLVGTLAATADRRIAFAYSEEWLESGFAISPFSLPVERKVFVPSGTAFHWMWGVFDDSLPDAWGQLLVNRMLQSRGLSSAEVTPLERLAIVGNSGMGALCYHPALTFLTLEKHLSLTSISAILILVRRPRPLRKLRLSKKAFPSPKGRPGLKHTSRIKWHEALYVNYTDLANEMRLARLLATV